MVVIGDAGGTTTDWRVIDQGKVHQFRTRGINVVHQTIAHYFLEIQVQISPWLQAEEVYFYVAGLLDQQEQQAELASSFRHHFKGASISLSSDLLGAARAMCGQRPGWVGILGTGANVAYYDGDTVSRGIAPLGYVLGDEGSGVQLGKQLLKDYLRGKLSKKTENAFLETFGLTESQALSNVYKSENPKIYLASFSTFIANHIQDPLLHRMVYDVFSEHIDTFYVHKSDDHPVHYVGSVAHYFSNILRQVAADRSFPLGNIAETPIAGLTLYHRKA
ncbi:MAG: glucosamine kinase [Cyclobacteriaceae bacterium]|jgi:glucosamine kinase